MKPSITKPNHEHPIMFYVGELLWSFLPFFVILHFLVGQQLGPIVDIPLVLVVGGVGEGVGAAVLLRLGRNRSRFGRKLVLLLFFTLLGTSTTCLRVSVILWQVITLE